MRRSVSSVSLALLTAGVLAGFALQPAQAQTITLDSAAEGRAFDGLGAVSGGGNTSRLLIDYPPAERRQILDYLFKPGFGASLNDLKVEVGGDVNSTQGSEPSHMHTRGDENYNRGFEWWLMEQAKARDPKITLECLAWGAPGWVGSGNFWSQEMMDYYIKWIKGAKTYHHLNIASVGGKNERGYDKSWYIGFRRALDAAGLSRVELVGSDDWGAPWLNLAKDSLADPQLARSLDAYAGHVTWAENPAVASPELLATGKPLWDTEMHNYPPYDHSKDGRSRFDAEISLVRGFNTNYIRTKITKTLFWNLIWSYYPVSSYPDVCPIVANTPWSGHYEVLPELWGYAHINQFAHPGWHFLERGGCGTLPAGGTYTTLESPNGRDYSVIAETKGATADQPLRLTAAGAMAGARTLHVWTSTAARQFVHAGDLKPDHGVFTLALSPDTVYSITTTTGQRKGAAPAPPADAPLALPYSDSYQEYPLASQARYHYDYEGAFEIAERADGRGKCLRQAAEKSANGWGDAYVPLTFLGSSEWKDYALSADAYIEKAGAVSLHGRIGAIPGGNDDDPPGYTFRIQDNGDWLLKSYKTTIAAGNAPFSADHWHHLAMLFVGQRITAVVDGKQVCHVSDGTYPSGLAGLGSGWNFAEFDNLAVQPESGP